MNSINLNNFAVEIIPKSGYSDKTVIDGAYYYKLPHKSEYKIKLSNNHNSKCDAIIWLEGEEIGTWRLNGYQSISIERPANIDRKFTFVRDTSIDAIRAGVTPNSDNNGLIKVLFKPEKDYLYTLDETWCGCRSLSMNNNINTTTQFMNNNINKSSSMYDPVSHNNVSSGATVLGDRSDQTFRTVGPLYNVDPENITTIYVRLLVDDSIYRKKYISLKDVHFL